MLNVLSLKILSVLAVVAVFICLFTDIVHSIRSHLSAVTLNNILEIGDRLKLMLLVALRFLHIILVKIILVNFMSF